MEVEEKLNIVSPELGPGTRPELAELRTWIKYYVPGTWAGTSGTLSPELAGIRPESGISGDTAIYENS